MNKHEERARLISAGLSNYIGNPKRRAELVEEIVDEFRRIERETWEKAASMMERSGDWRTMSRERAVRMLLAEIGKLGGSDDER